MLVVHFRCAEVRTVASVALPDGLVTGTALLCTATNVPEVVIDVVGAAGEARTRGTKRDGPVSEQTLRMVSISTVWLVAPTRNTCWEPAIC
jgi:hypothetical protein